MPTGRHTIRLHAPAGNAHASDRSLSEIGDGYLEHLVAAAFAAGRAEGLAAAREAGQALLEAASERLDAAREQAEEELPRVGVELALEVARQLLAVELDAGRYDLERIIRDSLAGAGIGRGECVVHVSLADAERLADVRWRSGTVVEADPNMQPGDVHVTTPRGLLVRELAPALDAIRDQLWEELA